jgi:hypothetical protein
MKKKFILQANYRDGNGWQDGHDAESVEGLRKYVVDFLERGIECRVVLEVPMNISVTFAHPDHCGYADPCPVCRA